MLFADIKEQKIALFMYIAVNSRRLLITWSSIADALNNFQGNLSEHIKGKFCAQPNGIHVHSCVVNYIIVLCCLSCTGCKQNIV